MNRRDDCDYRVALRYNTNVYIIPRIFVKLEGWEDITDIWDSGFDILKMAFPKIHMSQELYHDARHISFEEESRIYYMGRVSGWNMGWSAM